MVGFQKKRADEQNCCLTEARVSLENSVAVTNLHYSCKCHRTFEVREPMRERDGGEVKSRYSGWYMSGRPSPLTHVRKQLTVQTERETQAFQSKVRRPDLNL